MTKDIITDLPNMQSEDDPPCTGCGDTGIDYQTERRCACQGPATPDMQSEAVTAERNEKRLFAYTEMTSGQTYPRYINIKSFGGPIIDDPEYRVEILVRGKKIEGSEGPIAKISISRDEAVSMAWSILRKLDASPQGAI